MEKKLNGDIYNDADFLKILECQDHCSQENVCFVINVKDEVGISKGTVANCM